MRTVEFAVKSISGMIEGTAIFITFLKDGKEIRSEFCSYSLNLKRAIVDWLISEQITLHEYK
jgi:hypothetical protein